MIDNLKPIKVCQEHLREVESNSYETVIKTRCKVCRNIWARTYYEKNKKKISLWQKKNKEKVNLNSKIWRINNKFKFKLSSKKCKEKNKLKYKVKQNEWKKRNSEKVKEDIKKCKQRNKEKYNLIKHRINCIGRKELKDWYIKDKLRREGISNENITPLIIDIKRKFIKSSRLIKQDKNICRNTQ